MGAVARSVHLLLLPVLTREFSPGEYGKIDILATMAGFLTIGISLSLESAVARLWFESERGQVQKRLVSTVLTFVSLVGSIAYIVIHALSSTIAQTLLNDSELTLYVRLSALAAIFAAISGIPLIILRMQRKIALYTILNLVQTVSFVTLALLLLYNSKLQLAAVFVSQVCANALALAIGLVAISDSIGKQLSLNQLRSALRFSLPLLPSVSIAWLNNQVGRLSLLLLLGLGAVGVFGAAARVALIVGILVNVFQQAWTPLAISHIDQPVGRDDFYRRALNYYAASMTLIAFVFVVYSKELLTVLLPTQYIEGLVVIPWLVGAQILQGSGSITNVGMLVSKRTFGNSIAATCGIALNVGLSVFMIPLIGIWGAAIGSFIASLVFTSMQYLFTANTTTVRFDVGRLFAIVGCYVLTCIAVLACDHFLRIPYQSLTLRTLILLIAAGFTAWVSMDNHLLKLCHDLLDRLKTACC